MDPRFNLDPEIARMCDDAQTWLMMAACAAAALGRTLAQGIAAMLPRLHTGYMPEAQRRNLTHRCLRDGLRGRGPRDPYAGQKAAAARNGFVGGQYVGGGR